MSYTTNDPNLVDALYARMSETLERAVPSLRSPEANDETDSLALE
jgi:hypothetical protein